MQIPIIKGIYVDTHADMRQSYPRNLVPTIRDSGLSKGFLRQGDGLVQASNGAGPGRDRGGINWLGRHIRVMGSYIVELDTNGNITNLNPTTPLNDDGTDVSFAYNYGVPPALAIVASNLVYYLEGTTIIPAFVPNVGSPFDVIWIDGYFVYTDGISIYCTALNDIGNFNPFAYGSAESDPGPIECLLKLRNELVTAKRYVIEFFQNIGGSYFPFQRINGAEIFRGTVGRKTACTFLEQVAFIGSAKNEPLAIWMAVNGVANKISSAEIDYLLQQYTEAQLSKCVVEPRVEKNHAWLYVHLPDRTIVYDYYASLQLGETVWFTLDSGLGALAQYRAQYFVWIFNQWWFGDTATYNIGTFNLADSAHFGNDVSWEFGTMMIYNLGRQGIVHELELQCLTGAVRSNATPSIEYTYSNDGVTWSAPRPKLAGLLGNRNKRINWLNCGNIINWRIIKFSGDTQAHVSIMAIEARIEALGGSQ